jgi:hypothetical protein
MKSGGVAEYRALEITSLQDMQAHQNLSTVRFINALGSV